MTHLLIRERARCQRVGGAAIVCLGLALFALSAVAQSIQPIYSFTNLLAYPTAALTVGPDGNFYGTTSLGGNSGFGGDGTVFRITTSGAFSVLANFGGANGAFPSASLTLGPDGSFYGTTLSGGTDARGTVFRITTNGALTRLASFAETNGASPYAALTLGPDGSFYGTTALGGSGSNGTVFQFTTNGTLNTLYSFSPTNTSKVTNADGAHPRGGLTLGPDGNFYGTTTYGGTGGYGTVFQITTSGILTTLASFQGTNGGYSYAGLMLGPDSNFYGTTTYGGPPGGYGTVFQITTNDILTTLAVFHNTNGGFPSSGLTLGPDGNFYGTTQDGGSGGYGTVFRISTNGALTTLANFANTNGANPQSGLTLGPDGNFYGTASLGGSENDGAIFRLNLPPQPNCYAISNSRLGSVTLFLSGTPGSTNRLWTTTNPNLPLTQWQPIFTNVADATGLFQFTDTNTGSNSARFYILSSP